MQLQSICQNISQILDNTELLLDIKEITLRINYRLSEWIKIGVHPRKGSIITISGDDEEKSDFHSLILSDPKAAVRFLQVASIMRSFKFVAQNYLLRNENDSMNNGTAIKISVSENSNDYVCVDVNDNLEYTVSYCILGITKFLDPCVINALQWDFSNNKMILEVRKYVSKASVFASILSCLQEIDYQYIFDNQVLIPEDYQQFIFKCTSIVLPNYSLLSPIYISVQDDTSSENSDKNVIVQFPNFIPANISLNNRKYFEVILQPSTFYSAFFDVIHQYTATYKIIKQLGTKKFKISEDNVIELDFDFWRLEIKSTGKNYQVEIVNDKISKHLLDMYASHVAISFTNINLDALIKVNKRNNHQNVEIMLKLIGLISQSSLEPDFKVLAANWVRVDLKEYAVDFAITPKLLIVWDAYVLQSETTAKKNVPNLDIILQSLNLQKSNNIYTCNIEMMESIISSTLKYIDILASFLILPKGSIIDFERMTAKFKVETNPSSESTVSVIRDMNSGIFNFYIEMAGTKLVGTEKLFTEHFNSNLRRSKGVMDRLVKLVCIPSKILSNFEKSCNELLYPSPNAKKLTSNIEFLMFTNASLPSNIFDHQSGFFFNVDLESSVLNFIVYFIM